MSPAAVAALASYQAECDEPAGYLDFARVGGPLCVVRRARAAALEQFACSTDPVGVLEHEREHARELAARLAGFQSSEVTFAASTTAALFAVSFGMQAADTVMVPMGEFPANVIPWLRASARGGPQVVRANRRADGAFTADEVRAALTPEVSAVTISAVDYRTGWRAPLADIREVIGPERLLIVDAIQGFGVSDLTLEVADVVASGGQKWLRSGWGAALLAVREGAAERLTTDLGGWAGLRDPYAATFGSNPGPNVEQAERFLMTNTDLEAISGLGAGLGAVESCGVGVLSAALSEVTRHVLDVLALRGAEVVGSTWAEGSRAGIISFCLVGEPADETHERLRRAGVTATVREGFVRLSPHVSTSVATLERLASSL